MKKILAIILTLVMVFSIVPLGAVTVGAEVTSGTTGDCTWTLDGTVLTISGNGYMAWYDDDPPWKSFYFTDIVIENGVKSIGYRAFSECYSLTSITIPDSVTSIGEDAFYSCDSLTRVDITDLAAWCEISFYNNPLGYARNLYINDVLATNITIPDSVTSISDNAFAGCDSLTSVTIPNSITSIGTDAFYDCDNLTDVWYQGSWAEKNCISIGSLNSDLTDATWHYNTCMEHDYESNECLANCKNCEWKKPHLDVGTKYDKNNHWQECLVCDDKFDIRQHKNHSNNYDSATHAVDCYCGHNVTAEIHNYLYSYYTEEYICLCGAKPTIKASGNFNYFVSDNKATITDCDTSISGNIQIPSSIGGCPLVSIGDYAFSDCSRLTSITIPDSVTSIGNRAFSNCESLTSITIPDSVKSIGDLAFYRCESLTSIAIPDGVTSIGNSAFSYCYSLTSVTIGNSVTSIGDYAFYDCTSLTSITIPNSITSISDYAFYYCNSLRNITIPDSVTSIGEDAFYGCERLTSVIIGNGVTSIGDDAFGYCYYLREIWYKGSQADKEKIEIGDGNSYFNNATWHYKTCETHSYSTDCDTSCENCDWVRTNAIPHDYTDATCSKPKTCNECGETTGEVLEHEYKAATCTAPKTCKICGDTSGEKLSHDYKAATCTEPQTCKLCNDTIGEKLGHDYENATCKTPKTCKVCGKTSGDKASHDYKDATCTEPKTCKVCGKTSGKKLGHDYETEYKKATTKANGKSWKECTRCGKKKDESTIYKIKSVKLSTTEYTYNGKAKSPKVTVKDSKGNVIKDKYYTVTGTGKKKVGEYTVKVKFKTKYSGTVKLTYTINPKKSSVSSVTAATKSLKVKIKKVSSQATGYEIQYSTSKKFTKSTTKTKKITSYKTTSATIKSLKAKKTYYVRVRTYKTVDGKKYYSDWSSSKSKKTK